MTRVLTAMSVHFWHCCFGFTSLLSVLLSSQERSLVGAEVVLRTFCPSNYNHGEEVTVTCTHIPGSDFDVVGANCKPTSKGLQAFNDSTILGSSNCRIVNEMGLTRCPMPNVQLTKDASKYPKCSCESYPLSFVYQVKFIPHKFYDTGVTFSCALDCEKAKGGLLVPRIRKYGNCENIRVACKPFTYGPTCQINCGRCAGGNTCNDTTGKCLACESGFQLPFCRTCVPGLVAPDCQQCEKYGFKPPDCDRCEPNFLPPDCTNCKPGLQYPDCQNCIESGFLPPRCTDCLPGFQPPDCQRCVKPGFVPPSCRVCERGLLPPDCKRCERPGFQPPKCAECLPGYISPNCTECKPGLQYPECDSCIKSGFRPPNCTECLPGLQYPDCKLCINPDFQPPDCTLCPEGAGSCLGKSVASTTSVALGVVGAVVVIMFVLLFAVMYLTCARNENPLQHQPISTSATTATSVAAERFDTHSVVATGSPSGTSSAPDFDSSDTSEVNC